MSRGVQIVWWNTRLHGKRADEPEVARAAVVLGELHAQLACAAIVLCEVAPELDALLARSGLELIRSRVAGDDIVVALDRDQLDASFRRTITARVGGRPFRAATLFDLRLPGGATGVLATCHWAAVGNRGDQDDVASAHVACAVALQRELFPDEHAFHSEHLLVLGDFNAEPFDPAMRMLGTRDACRARRSDNLLYNLAWRWLGAQRPYRADDPEGEPPAGTYLLRSGGASRWRTFDQALVSASLVSRAAWNLEEGCCGPFLPVALRGERGAQLHGAADHLPILLSLGYTPRGSSEVDHDNAG